MQASKAKEGKKRKKRRRRRRKKKMRATLLKAYAAILSVLITASGLQG
jgi:hypothetical protein